MLTGPLVTVVSVCFNSSAVIDRMLISIPGDTPVILVDNCSEDIEEVRSIAKKRGAKVLDCPQNIGFGSACNLGASHADTEFLLFLNPDAELDSGAIDELIVAARKYPAACAFNPAIKNSSGRPYFKRSSVLLPKSRWMERGWPEKDSEVTVLSGAALLVRRTAFERVGGFDPEIFLYHEDDDLSLRLQQQCGNLMFIRGAIISHTGGASTEVGPETAALKGWHMGRSRVYAAQKHGQPFVFLRALCLASFQLLLPSSLLSKRKRAKQVAFLSGIWQAAQSSESESK